MMRMPAIVIGDHRNGGIAKLGFACQLSFLQIGHADHIHTQAAIDIRFRFGRKLRAFHAQISPARFADNACPLAGRCHNISNLSANWIGKAYVGDNALSKESIDTMPSAIEKLIGDYEFKRRVLFLQRSNRGNGNNALHSELFETMYVSPEIQLRRKNSMTPRVPGQAREFATFESS